MSMMGWCSAGDHENCKREYERFYFETRRGKSIIVWTGEMVYCECIKRGCKCHVPAKDRKTTATGRKRKRKS